MASTSGSVATNTTYDSYFWVNWSQSSQSVAENKTYIDWSCGVYCGHSFYSNAIKMSAVSINGSKVYEGGTYSNFHKGNHTIASGSMSIDHNSDGSKTFWVSAFTGWLYSNYNYSSNGDSFDLTTIPRASQPTLSKTSANFGEQITIYSNTASSTFKHKVYYRIGSGAWVQIIDEDPAAGSGGKYFTYSCLWTIPKTLMNNFPNSKTGTLEIGLDTYTDTTFSNFIGTKYVTLTASVPVDDTTKPSISMSISINNGSLSSTFDGIAIQGKTRIDVTLSGEAKYNANITGCSAVIDGKSYTAKYNSTSGKYELTSNAIENYGAVPAVGYVKDSRGFTNSETNFANVTPYEKPLVIPLSTENAIMCYRSDGNGVRVSNSTSVWIKAKRKYYPVPTLGIQNNFCSLQYRFKATDGSWSGWSDLISKSNLDTNEYNALIPDEVFNIKKAYTIQIRAIDDIGESDTKTFDIPTQDVALHLGKGGRIVSVGTYCDYSKPYSLQVEWDAYFKDIYINGTKLVDYIVEQGTNDIWTYRKWNSGIAECWGIATGSTATNDDSSVPSSTTVELPFLFVTATQANIQPLRTSENGWRPERVIPDIYNNISEITFHSYCIAEKDSDEIFYSIEVKGTWK